MLATSDLVEPRRLFGIFIAQVYYYYLTFKRDSPWLRAYVWVMR